MVQFSVRNPFKIVLQVWVSASEASRASGYGKFDGPWYRHYHVVHLRLGLDPNVNVKQVEKHTEIS